MVEWLKNNKWLFWLVPIVVGIIKIIDILNYFSKKKSDTELKDSLERGAESLKSQAEHEARADSHITKAKALEDERAKLYADLDWHKNFKE